MKKIYILATMVAFAFTANAQIVDDEFEFYQLGDIDAQSPSWRTWSDAPGNAEDADVTDLQNNTVGGDKSLNIGAGNDMLLLFGDLTTGVYSWQYDLYLEPGSSGFLGMMSETTTEFALQMYFDDATIGTSFADPIGNTNTGDPFTIEEETWVTHRWVIDLDAGTAIVTQDGEEIYNGDFFRNALQSVDIWDDANANFHLDNVLFVEGEILNTDDFSSSSFSVYPNPVQDRLNIQSVIAVDSVIVYDVLGKVVLTATPGVVSPSVDMSALTSGAYLVNITINGASKTVKVVK
tara:strand:- start:12141 stop:13016 length:876 start_codon:yes stop_codon:yes gene_type:complete